MNSTEIGDPTPDECARLRSVWIRLEGHLTRGDCSLSSPASYFYSVSHLVPCRAPKKEGLALVCSLQVLLGSTTCRPPKPLSRSRPPCGSHVCCYHGKEASTVTYFILVLTGDASLGPQVRTPPTPIREKENVSRLAFQPCKLLAAVVSGNVTGIRFEAGEKTRIIWESQGH